MEPISILIAGRNTKSLLPLCLRSLRSNLSRKDHRILILDDASTDGSAEWLIANRDVFGIEVILHPGPERLGIVHAYNRLVELANEGIVWLVHTDMYFAPGADAETARYLAPGTVCTCTRIEPPLYPAASYKIVADLGMDAETFQEEEFLALAAQSSQPGRSTEGIFAPIMCYREDYLAVGGLDPVFAPQSREDSDLFNRMAVAGYLFRQSWSAFCYHFSGRGSRKKDGLERDSSEWQQSNRKNERNFIRRWGQSVRHTEWLRPIVMPRERISLVGLLGADEVDNVRAYLEHLEPYVDDIVLVSDGPQPAAIAQVDAYVADEIDTGPVLVDKLKIRVVERLLGQDFSAQRNFGQSSCRYNWILHIDLDERVDRSALEGLQDQVSMMRRNAKNVCGFARINTLDGVVVNDLPRDLWTSEVLAKSSRAPVAIQAQNIDAQFRLMKRDVTWVRRVHEVPGPVMSDHDSVTMCGFGSIRHPKTLARQRRQDARYEAIRTGAGLRPTTSGRPSRLRILMLATEYPPASGYGLGRYASEMAKALVALGIDVHVVCGNIQAGMVRCEQDGVVVHLGREAHALSHYQWVSDAVVSNLWLLERALEVVRDDDDFDMVVSHDWIGSLAAHGVAVAHHLPWILVMHDTEPGKRQNRLSAEQVYIAEMETWSCMNADRIIVSSAALAAEVRHFHRTQTKDLLIVPCGIDVKSFRISGSLSDFRGLHASPGQKIVLYVGRLSPMKGVDIVIEAAPEILQRCPDTNFIIVGDGILHADLSARASELGISNRVSFVGHVNGMALAALYRIADVVAMPSRYEPFGMVALEAMACGAPIACAAVGGLKEIIPNHPLTRVIAGHDARQWARNVVSLLAEPRTPVATASLIQHAESFSWKQSAQMFASAACNDRTSAAH